MSGERAGQGRTPGPMIDTLRLKKERNKRGLGQVQFAELCGIGVRRMGDLERSPLPYVQPRTIKKIAEALGLAPGELIREENPPLLISNQEDLVAENLRIVETAHEFLYVTGSRSRDDDYLAAIAASVESKPDFVHRRILFGPPRSEEMFAHIRGLLGAGDPRRRFVRRVQSVGIAICSDQKNYPAEACICMNEKRALLVLPSIISPWQYDTAIVFDNASVIAGWKSWVDTMFRTATQISEPAQLEALANYV